MPVTADDIQKAIVPLAAAFAGAFTAQNIAERNRRREDVLKELRSTNAAISLAFAICNAGIALKRQNIAPLRKQYDESKEALLEFKRRRKAGEIPRDQPFESEINARVLHVPKLDAGTLRAHVLDRINVAGRPLHLAVVLDDAATALTAMMEQRNQQVVEMQQAGGQQAAGFMNRYFGLPTEDGVDERYGNVLHAMADSVDDLIFFAQLLCKDLEQHGKRVLDRYPRRFFVFREAHLPRIQQINFEKPTEQGLVPGPQKYADWLTAFVAPQATPSLWHRIRHPGSRREAKTPDWAKS